MSGLLQGRVAIVTGAGRSIGRAIAESLIAEGAKVIVADNGTSIAGDGGDPQVARTAAQEMNDKSGARNALAFTESVASPGIGKQLVDLAVKTFGGIDIVVNNAAIRRDAPVFCADPADWDAVIRTNLSAAFYLINAASAVMREQDRFARGGRNGYEWGRIVNIVSSAGLHGALGQAAYASAKAGLVGLTRVTAMDLAPAQITVNAIVPVAHTHVIDAQPVASLVTALCSPAGTTITGQVLGARGREVFLVGQPRPVAHLEAYEPETLAQDIVGKFGSQFTDLTTDLEAFDTDSLV
jgi:NAD(P)-dependent dehydrogenase (short-subunit alcohol dehydrogenase family)